MTRRLFTIAAALSLLLGLATVALWVRSYWYYDSCSYGRATGTFWELSSAGGHVCAEAGSSSMPLEGVWATSQQLERGMVMTWGSTNPLGFRLTPSRKVIYTSVSSVLSGPPTLPVSSSTSWVSHSSLLVIPYWFAILLTAILPAARLYKSKSAPGPGLCRKCSYDLTGNQSGVCPECGTAASSRNAL